jgi:hypothetical protein
MDAIKSVFRRRGESATVVQPPATVREALATVATVVEAEAVQIADEREVVVVTDTPPPLAPLRVDEPGRAQGGTARRLSEAEVVEVEAGALPARAARRNVQVRDRTANARTETLRGNCLRVLPLTAPRPRLCQRCAPHVCSQSGSGAGRREPSRSQT